MSEYLVSVLKFYLKGSVRERFEYRSLYFDNIFFRQAFITLL